MKLIKILLLCSVLGGCGHSQQSPTVTIHTFIYPPYTDNGPSGLFVDLITAAYASQGVAVNFAFDTLEGAAKSARDHGELLLASRSYKGEYAQEIGYEEFYDVDTKLLSIQGRQGNAKIGTFSSDEVLFAKRHNLTPVKYTTPGEGLQMLSAGVVDSIICTDINCDQIKMTNPTVNFVMEYGYSLPVDIVYFDKTPSAQVKNNITILKKGIKEILANGKFVKIQESYRVANPVFQITLEGLLNIKIDE